MDTRLVVVWSYTHTGGLPITAVDVEFQQDAANVRTSFSDVDSSMVDGSGEMVDEGEASIPLPQAGIRYRFYVTATNSEGASTTSCPDLLLTIGQCALDWLLIRGAGCVLPSMLDMVWQPMCLWSIVLVSDIGFNRASYTALWWGQHSHFLPHSPIHSLSLSLPFSCHASNRQASKTKPSQCHCW